MENREMSDLLGRLAAGETLPDGDDARKARRLFDAARRALASPQPSKKLMRKALRIYRDARKPARPSLLRLAFDSLAQPAPAVRRAGALKQDRFLRFEGVLTVELAVATRERGLELRGQIIPADAVPLVLIGGRSVPVDSDGTFVARGVPRGPTDISVGAARISDLVL